MIKYCGFNRFGQFTSAYGDHNYEFRDVELTDDDKRLLGKQAFAISISWSYTVYASANKLLVKGFISNKTHNKFCIDVAVGVRQVCSCDAFILIVYCNGTVSKLYHDMGFQMEDVKLDGSVELRYKRSATGEVKYVWTPIQITNAACGTDICVLYTNSNKVYTLPNKVYQFPRFFRLKQLLCGYEHALYLNQQGEVYSWGDGMRGQLGHGELENKSDPERITFFNGIKIVYIAAHGWHNAAITLNGDLFTWGYNTNGQLGIRIYETELCDVKAPSIYPVPEYIELPECCMGKECTAARVVCGARHTILLMSCGTLYGLGWNAHGQLGYGPSKNYTDIFKKMPYPASPDNVDHLAIACGPWSTLIRDARQIKKNQSQSIS